MKCVFRVLLDMVQKETFYAALVQDYLREAGEVDRDIGNAVGSSNDAIWSRILHEDSMTCHSLDWWIGS
jgi:hypothetical protein